MKVRVDIIGGSNRQPDGSAIIELPDTWKEYWNLDIKTNPVDIYQFAPDKSQPYYIIATRIE